MKPIKKIIIIFGIALGLTGILSLFYYNTNIGRVFDTIWKVLMFICTILFGVFELSERQNKIAACFYFILAFILFLLLF
ncbi:hypothetical protein [Sedimentibacter sp. MB31-C6]|uniref:hypothetical protein n=1 Tax=Sedimentibacter sp. MB31-C6 TaxID=3109366 RepID=UPI002DDD228A|nr:hypothetical protein [Sedimentibacter sp. MB36-C1]WSI04592.1 hypothetical protein U8307_02060 [Sedimentibacter sp. MB36-C1]